MSEEVEELCHTLHFETKFKATHNFLGQLLPFHTRNPERVKFTNGFAPVLGVITRIVNERNEEISLKQDMVVKPSLETNVKQEIIEQLFSANVYREMNSSKLLQYLPLSEGNERKGEILLGRYIVELLDLKNNVAFVDCLSQATPRNLYEKIIFDSLESTSDTMGKVDNKFKYYDGGYLRELFLHDVQNLVQDKHYFYNHISELLEFYYFTYITQVILRLSDSQVKSEILPVYFTIENESISRSRKAISTGYNLVYQHGQDVLTDSDILNYLNMLIPDNTQFYWKNEILSPNFPFKESLYKNVVQFLPRFKAQLDREIIKDVILNDESLEDAISSLRELLVKRSETSEKHAAYVRYAKSFEEISKQGFSRSHGRLGRVFSLNRHTILFLTTAIIGSGKKPLNDVFNSFQKRGIFFDRITRDKVINLYEQANVLEKLSDSGDAQYVRGIL